MLNLNILVSEVVGLIEEVVEKVEVAETPMFNVRCAPKLDILL
jgi:hypothetical protein